MEIVEFSFIVSNCTSETSAPISVLLRDTKAVYSSHYSSILNVLTSNVMQELLLSLLFADNIGLINKSNRKISAMLQILFNKGENIVEEHWFKSSRVKD